MTMYPGRSLTRHVNATTIEPIAAGTAVVEQRAAVAALQARMTTILNVMAAVLESGKDYGRIPGTGDKPTLYKPGAEKLCLAFSLAPIPPLVDDLSSPDEIRYRLTVSIENSDGRTIAAGIGEASSNEEKYRWRRPVCDEEWAETPVDLRREKWFRGKNNAANWKGKQIRTSPADVANTILKMAHKRAFIHATLLATGASSVFNQDLEDFTKELQQVITEADPEAKKRAPVQRASETGRRGTGPSPAAAPPLETTAASRVQEVLADKDGQGRPYFVIVLVGDPRSYLTRNATLAADVEKCKGTDHTVRVAYRAAERQGKTHFNVENISIDTGGAPFTAQDIPFGS